MIEISDLEKLLVFYEYGTLSKAADASHISQPSFTRAMKALEEELEVPLFIRSKNKLELNDNGLLLVEHAKKIMDDIDILKRDIQKNNAKTINFASSAPVPIDDLYPLLKDIYPNSTINHKLIRDEKEMLEDLKNKIYDFIIVHEKNDDKDLYFLDYREENLSLMVPKVHPLSKKKKLHLEDFKDQNILLLEDIGFWYDICKDILKDSHFLYLKESGSFSRIIETAAFPYFTSDVFDSDEDNDNVIRLPIAEDLFHVHYFFVINKKDVGKYKKLIDILKEF